MAAATILSHHFIGREVTCFKLSLISPTSLLISFVSVCKDCLLYTSILTNDVMSELNYRVDVLQQSPEQVAKDFLNEAGLSTK